VADVQIRVRAKDEASPVLGKIGASFNQMASGIGNLAGAPLALGIAAAAAAIKTMVGALDDLDEAAQSVSVSASALADLRLGASQAGVGAEQLDKALVKLNLRLADAREGGAESQRIFAALGVNYRDTSVNAEEALKALARGVSSWADGAEKVRFLEQVLGEKIGPKFIAFLNAGEEGLKRFSGVTPELVANAAKLQTEIDKLSVSWERLKNAVLGATLPAINNLIDGPVQLDETVRLTQQLAAEVENLNRLRNVRGAGILGALQVSEDDITKAAARVFDLRVALQDAAKAAATFEQNFPGGKASAPSVAEKKAGPAAKLDDSFLRRAEALDAELRKLNEVSAVEQVLLDIEQGRIKIISEGERQYLLQLAAGLDARKERIAAAQEEGRTIAAAMENAIAAQARLDEITGRAGRERQARDQAALDDAFFSGKISTGEYDAGLKNVFGIVDATNEKLKEQKSLVEEIGLTFTSAFEDAIGSGNGLRNVLKGLGQDILRLATRKLITEPLGNAFMDLLKGVNLAGLFGGARAAGGPVAGGTAYLVGEQGPELFVPTSAGTIVPNGAGGGVSVVINQQIDSRSDIATIRASAQAAVLEAERRILNSQARRGAFA
jgi:hypothetical protein